MDISVWKIMDFMDDKYKVESKNLKINEIIIRKRKKIKLFVQKVELLNIYLFLFLFLVEVDKIGFVSLLRSVYIRSINLLYIQVQNW